MRAFDFLLIIGLMITVLLSGCGGAALKTNAVIARGMLAVQEESGALIRQARIQAGVAAANQARADGLQIAEALERVDDSANAWQCAVQGHRVYSTAVGSYIDTIVLIQAGAPFELVYVLPFMNRAVNAYRSLALCLDSLGSDILPTPDFLNLIPDDWAGSTP